eukprot:1818213-Ditylum_brightwellii.AAC.1
MGPGRIQQPGHGMDLRDTRFVVWHFLTKLPRVFGKHHHALDKSALRATDVLLPQPVRQFKHRWLAI